MEGLSATKPRSAWLPWVLAGAAAALASVLTFDPKLYINGDNIDYMFLARSVRAGDLWPSDKYPPLFPFLLAPVQGLFGLRLIPQKLLVLAFYFGSVWMLGRIVRRRFAPASGPWLLLIAATLVPLVEYSHYVMSEVPYLFFLLGAVDAADRCLAGSGSGPGATVRSGASVRDHLRRREIWFLALWAGAAFYTRSAGAALGAGILLALLLAGRRRQAAAAAIALLAVSLPWFLHGAFSRGGSPYLRQLLLVNPYYPEFGPLTAKMLWLRLRDNGHFYFLQEIPTTLFPVFYRSTYSPPGAPSMPLGLGLPLLLPLAAGFWRAGRRGDPIAVVTALTLVQSCLWPLIWAGSRFLVPIVPLLFLLWWRGWGVPETIGWAGPWKWIRRGLLVVLLLLGARNLVFYARETRAYPPEWARYFQALEWVRENTPADAVIIDRKPGFVEFVAGRKAVNFPREPDPDRMLQAFRERKGTHVILSSLPYDDIGRYLKPVLEQRRPYFTLLYRQQDPAVYVLQFHPEGNAGTVAPGAVH